jgi:hypothetical protein
MKTTAETMTAKQASILWIACAEIGNDDAVRTAATARRDILAGQRDTFAVQWAATMYGQIPAGVRRAAVAEVAQQSK